MFLARTVEGTTDVEGMLSRMGPSQFEMWWREYLRHPWCDNTPTMTMLAGYLGVDSMKYLRFFDDEETD